MTRFRLPISLFASLIFLAACSPEKDTKAASQTTPTAIDSSAFAAQVGIDAYASLSAASQDAQTMDNQLASFMYHPNPMSKEEIRQSWRTAYNSFLHSLVFSYLPIQDPPDWHTQGIGYSDLLTQLDSWPIEGGYIDHLPGYPFSGIVNDLTLEINEASLRSQHGFTDPTNASLGYHAIEFMFWGADGERSAHDFFPQENTAPVLISDIDGGAHDHGEVAIESSDDTVQSPQNHNRRRQYTQLLTELLQKDLHRVQRRWEASHGYYSQLINQNSPDNVLQAAFIAGQRLLSEEILTKRFQLTSSEFSKSSAQDISAVLMGLQSWYFPSEQEQQKSSLGFLIDQINPQIAAEFLQSFTTTQTCLHNMTGAPESISECKQATIGLLSDLLRSAKALGVSLPKLD